MGHETIALIYLNKRSTKTSARDKILALAHLRACFLSVFGSLQALNV
jgi:hypothetical protein